MNEYEELRSIYDGRSSVLSRGFLISDVISGPQSDDPLRYIPINPLPPSMRGKKQAQRKLKE